MDALADALRGAAGRRPAAPARPETLLVVGGGGVLGAALLARALACGRFHRVQALVAKELASALRGFEPLPQAALGAPLRAGTAFIVFERARRNNGRDEAFVQPQPQQLAPLATQLHAGGVRRLLVLVPHAPALLPQALQSGLASLDEAHVAALGFEHVLLLRAAQSAAGTPVGGWARRAATGAVYLDAEYTVLEGPYARRKVWSLIGLYSPKGPDWANMGRGLIRGILNSARGVSDKDNSPEAQARRRINGFGDLDGVEFVARIDIGTDTNGEDKNEIRAAVTPDHRDYAALMGAVAPQFTAAPAQGHAPQQPITATQPSQPASAPGAAGRPSWAQ